MKRFEQLPVWLVMAMLVWVGPAFAWQDEDKEEEQAVYEEMTVGSRRMAQGSKTETPAPVDVIPASEIAVKAAQMDLGQLLQFTSPSFNTNRQSGSDGSDHVDAATLRGLGPDQVLVLINGKRRHTSSLVYLFGTRGRGNVGTDLNTIPVAAIKRIEVLRDGAAAQYGSDAIAGVINIVLEDQEGLNLTTSAGQYQESDGEMGQVALNYGLGFENGARMNLTGEFLTRDRTNRSGPDEPRIIGDAETENVNLFYDLAVPVGEDGRFYSHGGVNRREGVAGAWYRGGLDSGDIPSRNSAAMYPNGFVPDIATDIDDYSTALGFRTLLGDWFMDVSGVYGSNRMEYTIKKTLNASIANLNDGISPTVFDAGGFQFTQMTGNLDFSRYYPDLLNGVNVALGLEYRRESYEIFDGERGSWDDYDGAGGGNAGSQGFPGFQPVDEVDASRNSQAAYMDVEWQLSDAFLLATAIRAEDYSDFGSTTDGKIAFSYRVNEAFRLRGSASTGFRAPSLHQRWFSSTFTDFIAGVAADVKLSPNESELARLVGIPALKEETSQNLTVGFTYNREKWNFTLDVYHIDIDDRIVLTGGFTGDDPDIGDIINEQQLSEARFFTNAIDTRTKGLDFTVNHRMKLNNGSFTSWLALNFNESEVLQVNTAPGLEGKEDLYFNHRERLFVEGSAPDFKGTLTFDYERGPWFSNMKFAWFGDVEAGTWTQIDDPTAPSQYYDPEGSMDLAIGFKAGPAVLSIGGGNIFDNRPTRQDPNETENGAPWENVQMGINGAFYYARVNVKL